MPQSTADKIYRELLKQKESVLVGTRHMCCVKTEVDAWDKAVQIAYDIAQANIPR